MSHDLKPLITRLKLRRNADDDAMREKFVRDLDEMQALVQETRPICAMNCPASAWNCAM